MITPRRHWLIPLLLFVSLSVVGAQAKQLAVVVNKANTTTNLSAADLAKIFKLENRKWADGTNVILILRDPSTPEMQTALQKLYKMTADEFKTLLATHRGSILIVKSEEELLRFVSATPGAIGLVDVFSISSGINVIKVDGKLPLEPGYLLRGN